MRRTIMLGTFVVALSVLTAAAAVGSTRAWSEDSATASSGLVGTWRVVVTNPDGSTFPVLSSFMADGTTIHAGPISSRPRRLPPMPSSSNRSATGSGRKQAPGHRP